MLAHLSLDFINNPTSAAIYTVAFALIIAITAAYQKTTDKEIKGLYLVAGTFVFLAGVMSNDIVGVKPRPVAFEQAGKSLFAQTVFHERRSDGVFVPIAVVQAAQGYRLVELPVKYDQTPGGLLVRFNERSVTEIEEATGAYNERIGYWIRNFDRPLNAPTNRLNEFDPLWFKNWDRLSSKPL